MPTLKDTLCLLVIFLAYGIVGQMDYEDAVRLEETHHQKPTHPAGARCVALTHSSEDERTSVAHSLPLKPQTDHMVDRRASSPSLCPAIVF